MTKSGPSDPVFITKILQKKKPKDYVISTDKSYSVRIFVEEAYKNIGGKYPSTSQGLEALLKRPQSSPRPRDWVQALDDEEALFDPWDTKYKYEYPGSKNPSRPEIISAGPDKQFGSEDDMSSQKDPQN